MGLRPNLIYYKILFPPSNLSWWISFEPNMICPKYLSLELKFDLSNSKRAVNILDILGRGHATLWHVKIMRPGEQGYLGTRIRWIFPTVYSDVKLILNLLCFPEVYYLSPSSLVDRHFCFKVQFFAPTGALVV